jgi:hypothetical protein
MKYFMTKIPQILFSKNPLKFSILKGLILGLFLMQISAVQAPPQDEAKSETNEQSMSSSAPILTGKESDFKKKVKLRQYPGGKDEQDLKVNNLIYPITRKMNPVVESPIIETPDTSEDNDSE